jgi:hypothetical protein
MKKNKTALDWFVEQMKTWDGKWEFFIHRAKQMEREQIITTWEESKNDSTNKTGDDYFDFKWGNRDGT